MKTVLINIEHNNQQERVEKHILGMLPRSTIEHDSKTTIAFCGFHTGGPGVINIALKRISKSLGVKLSAISSELGRTEIDGNEVTTMCGSFSSHGMKLPSLIGNICDANEQEMNP